MAATTPIESIEASSMKEAKPEVDAAAEASSTMTLWSEMFASPSNGGGAFSPAKPAAESRHGAGLLKALERGKLEARCGRRCSLMLLESASCYEQFGVAAKKACHTHAQLLEGGDAFSSVVSLGQQTRALSIRLREDIALPLQGFHAIQGETIGAMHQKYEHARKRAYQARQKALLGREKYWNAVQDAEAACSEVEETVTKPVLEEKKVGETSDATEEQEETSATKPTSERSLEDYGKLKGQDAADRVTHLLHTTKVLQRRYESLVEKENEAVKFAQHMEAIALEGLQKLEEQRLCLFYDSIVRTFQGIKTCLDSLVIAAEAADLNATCNEGDPSRASIHNKKGDFFTALLKVGHHGGAHAHEKTGVADAETLGLSENVGKLRDEVQSRSAAKLARLKKVKGLAAFLEDIAAAAAKLGHGLQQVVKHEDSYVSSQGTPVEHLRTLLSNCEGPRTLRLWNDLMKTLETEGVASHQFATSLRSIKASKLDPMLSFGNEKVVRDETEVYDGLWRVLCDAARTEMRADAKYRNNAAQTTKARERVRSVDMDAVPDKPTKSPQKANRARDGMNKAFGNFLSILPDGGEQAMQMLTPEARRAVAERTLQEADQKESKGKQTLEDASAWKITSMESYQSKTELLITKYEQEENSGVEDIKAAMESLLATIGFLRKARYESLGPLSQIGAKPLMAALADLREWTQKAAEEIATSNETANTGVDESTATSGFMLHVVFAESEYVSDFARVGKTDSFESDCSDASSEKDDASAASGVAVQVPGQDSNRSLDLSAVKNEEEAGQKDPKNGRWLQKSLSAPLGKPGGFKKFRKAHTIGDADSEMDAADDETEISTVSTTVPPQNRKESFETDIFLTFWPDYAGTPPGVTNSFACAFLPKHCKAKDVGSVEHGRLFLTHKGAVFVAWRGKKALLYFSAMVSVEKSDSMLGLADDTLLVTSQSSGLQNTLLLGNFNFRDTALQVMQGRIAKAKKSREEAEATNKTEARSGPSSGSDKVASTAVLVGPDPQILKMEVVLSKKIRGISVDRFHEIVWSDMTPDESFYGSWLGKGNCSEIKVSEWETPEKGCKGTWCGDSYTHKRSLGFKLKRNSMIGPPVAGVTQTQYSRLDGKDRSIMQMTVAFDGIPYSDTFTVEVRWVATRSGAKDISVQVGVFVEFHKSTLLKSQIRNGTMTETKPVHESLFEFVKIALAKEVVLDESGDDDIDDDDDDGLTVQETDTKGERVLGMIKSNLPDVVADNIHIVGPVLILVFLLICRRMFSSAPDSLAGVTMPLAGSEEISALNTKVDGLQTEMKLMRQAMEELTELVRNQALANNGKLL